MNALIIEGYEKSIENCWLDVEFENLFPVKEHSEVFDRVIEEFHAVVQEPFQIKEKGYLSKISPFDWSLEVTVNDYGELSVSSMRVKDSIHIKDYSNFIREKTNSFLT